MAYFKTRIVFEVLHNEDLHIEQMSLEEIGHETIDGEASGMVLDSDTQEITKEQAHAALIAQGSDETFLD